MGGINKYCVALAACIVICAAQPVNKLPVLKDIDEEILFRVSDKPQPLVLECLTEGAGNQQIKYSWHKNGQPFNWQSHSDVTQRQNEGSLVFNKPKNDDEGLYQCFAESENGVASSRVVKVKRAYLNAPKVDLRKHKPVESRPFKLDCAIPDSYPKPTIVWKRLVGSDLTQAKPFLDRRITLSPEGDLYFTNVTQEDISKTEKYVCLATSPAATNSEVLLAEHLLEEIVADKEKNNGELVLQYVSPDMTVKAGSVTMIYCMYGSTPLAFPDWFQNGKNVNNNPGDRITRHNRTSGKRLLIKETLLEDQATYTCVVDNEVGKQQKHAMRLTVVSTPTYSKKPEKQVVVKEGQDVTIPCHVDAVPAPKLSWTYNAKPLQLADRITLNTSGSSQKSAVSDLTIKKVTKSDKGYYGCKAVNDHGDNYSETLLVVA